MGYYESHTSINQSIITGESLSVDKTAGDGVFVGTLNQLGVIELEATKVGEDTSLAKLIRLVRGAENKKAPVVRITDRVATIAFDKQALLTWAEVVDIIP